MITRETLQQTIRHALKNEQQTDYLHCSVKKFVDQGVSRDWLHSELLRFKENELRTTGPERLKQDDILDEVIEALVGWCSPHRRI